MADTGTVQHVMANGNSVEKALQRAAMAARREYVRAGLSMPVWRGGRLVWVETAELARYEADETSATRGLIGAPVSALGRPFGASPD
jgi:hypothetical protein